VQAAQELGVQVVGLVVPDEAGQAIAVSRHLRRTFDRVVHIDDATIDHRVRRATVLTAVPAPADAAVLRLPVPPRLVPVSRP
jgi:hypothetical protein